jgi:hypothetical protein
VLCDVETVVRSIRGKRSLTMLMAASAGGYEHVVTELLSINADVDAKDKYESVRQSIAIVCGVGVGVGVGGPLHHLPT